MGKCENVGQNAGYAYLSSDETCPLVPEYLELGVWRRGGSNKLLTGYTRQAAFSADGHKPQELSSTVSFFVVYRVSHNTWDYKNALGRPLNNKIERWEVSHFKAKDHVFEMRGVRF
jgi:hypothetical protein